MALLPRLGARGREVLHVREAYRSQILVLLVENAHPNLVGQVRGLDLRDGGRDHSLLLEPTILHRDSLLLHLGRELKLVKEVLPNSLLPCAPLRDDRGELLVPSPRPAVVHDLHGNLESPLVPEGVRGTEVYPHELQLPPQAAVLLDEVGPLLLHDLLIEVLQALRLPAAKLRGVDSVPLQPLGEALQRLSHHPRPRLLCKSSIKPRLRLPVVPQGVLEACLHVRALRPPVQVVGLRVRHGVDTRSDDEGQLLEDQETLLGRPQEVYAQVLRSMLGQRPGEVQGLAEAAIARHARQCQSPQQPRVHANLKAARRILLCTPAAEELT
mmetsp:Transcript_1067/g.3235  ORF Transcript_1067/g.3235 Transcript_1067/m.3235 type:complete len:326 (-) Transcript_1067:404-1381(-)